MDEEGIRTSEESLISFWLSGPNEEQVRDNDLESDDESTVMLPKKKPRKEFSLREREEEDAGT